MGRFMAIVRRDLRLALHGGGDGVMVVAFFVLAAILFPFGVGPDTLVLTRIGPGIIWVTALLATMLSLERLFLGEFEDGSLDHLALSSQPLEIIVIAKVTSHWLTTGLPLLVAAPVLAAMFNLPGEAYLPMLVGLGLGTPTLSLVGSIGAALALGARRGGVLLSLIVLPLYIPVLIFGVGTIETVMAGGSARAPLMILGAFALVALALAPWAAAAALRQALD